MTDATKQGGQLDALLTALQSAQERRRVLEVQLAKIDRGAVERFADPERLRTELLRRASDIRGVLARRDSETRRVLQAAFAERIEFAPFNEGATHGYQFSGNGSYGGILVGDTCPTSHGGPNGIRTRVSTSPHAFASESTTCGVLSQLPSGGDGNIGGGRRRELLCVVRPSGPWRTL